MVTTLQTQETTNFSLEPLVLANGTDPLPPGSRPFDNDSLVPVTFVHAEATPETTETTTQVTMKGLVTTSSPLLFASDENSVLASGTFGDSMSESYTEDHSISQETAVSSQSAALTTSGRHMTDTTVPATPQILAPESTIGHTSALADEIQFDASTSVTTTGRLATIPYVNDDTSALSSEGKIDTTTNMTTIGQPASDAYTDDHTSALANEATTNLDTSSPPATASTGDVDTNASLFTLTTREATPVHLSPAEDASNFVADVKDDDAKLTTAPLPDQGSATITTESMDSTMFSLQTSGHEGQSTRDGNTVAIVKSYATETSTSQPSTAAYVDDHTPALAYETITSVNTTSVPATVSTGDDDTIPTAFTVTTTEAAAIHASPAEDASNLVADANDDDTTQTTAPVPYHGSTTMATKVVDTTVFLLQTSGDEDRSTTDGSTVATVKSSSYATETTIGQPATVSYVDDHTSALANEATTKMDTTSPPVVASTNDNDTVSTLFSLTTSEAAHIHPSLAEGASNLVADVKNDDDSKQTTAPFQDQGSATITTQVADSKSGDEVHSTTDRDTVATLENSSYATETAMLKIASMSATGLLDAPVTREGLKVTAVASNQNNSASSATVGASSVTESMEDSTTIPTPSPTTGYTEEIDQLTSSSASTDTTVTVSSNAAASPAESTTQLNYAPSREYETNQEGSSAEELRTTGPSFYSLTKVPELHHEAVDGRSTATTPTSATRRYKPAYVRRFTPWVITRSSSSLAITSLSSPTSSPLRITRPQVEQDTLKAQESSTVEYVPMTSTDHVRRYQKDPTSMQGIPVTSTARARIPPSDTLVVPESFFGSRSLFNRFGRPYCPGCDALLIKLPARFSVPLVPPYVYG
ncbi:uncharacterized protein LOC125944580 [Dermacentor silvarum]|uniref:uncharacterized protein LOC125944580 n=1 Tax=Dermacentor silvarum TaxID=543639 RepID=UPI002101C761|nr:uncharacterized protein LOC125944580 [Dermacentor silvarum]